MYALPCIQDLSPLVDPPRCMYALPPHQAWSGPNGLTSSGSAVARDIPVGSSELDAFEERQEQLLQRLRDLSSCVGTLRRTAGVGANDPPLKRRLDNSLVDLARAIPQCLPVTRPDLSWSWTLSLQAQVLRKLGDWRTQLDQSKLAWTPQGPMICPAVTGQTNRLSLVVHADPRYPPYSLLCLAKNLSASGPHGCPVSNHSHSTLKDSVHKNLCRQFDSSVGQEITESTSARFRLAIIWKPVGLDPHCCVGFIHLKGEANILRYAVRHFSEEFTYESNDHEALVIDSLLDDIHENVIWGSERDALSFLERSESFFLRGSKRSFVDFFAWSAILNKRFTIPSRKLVLWYTTGLREHGIQPQRRNSTRNSESHGGSSNRHRKKSLSCSSNHSTIINGNNEDKVHSFLKANKIHFKTMKHPAVLAVDELMIHLKDVKGLVSKNLFVRDKQKNLFLISVCHDRQVQLADIARKLGTKDLRFADGDILHDKLGVGQGAVSAFALLNDPGHDVHFVVDKALVVGGQSLVHFHPMVNTQTTSITSSDFARFLTIVGHKVSEVEFK